MKEAAPKARLGVTPYKNEPTLFMILAILAISFWVLVTFMTLGVVWFYVLLFFIGGLFGYGALISHLKGNAVRISSEQFPELHERLVQCCKRIRLKTVPEAYVMQANGILNAFATRFLRRYYVVLLSDIVDALEDDPEGINFYLGHELGHVARKHLVNSWWLAPVMFLPLIGAAYRRAEEYTCDRYGLACCATPESAQHALAVLAAGPRQWKTLNTQDFMQQSRMSNGFWMSFNELTADYPWLCKRMAHIRGEAGSLPQRHPLAWVLAFFVPRVAGGASGGIVGMMIIVAVIGILAAIALPAYHDYVTRAQAYNGYAAGKQIAQGLTAYYHNQGALPAKLDALSVPSYRNDASIESVEYDPSSAEFTVLLKGGNIFRFTPKDKGLSAFTCQTNIAPRHLPKKADCTPEAGKASRKPAITDLL